MIGVYRCPNCGTSALPVIERRISTAGWIVFSLLLLAVLIPSALVGAMTVAWAVIIHEGSEILAVINGLRVAKD